MSGGQGAEREREEAGCGWNELISADVASATEKIMKAELIAQWYCIYVDLKSDRWPRLIPALFLHMLNIRQRKRRRDIQEVEL